MLPFSRQAVRTGGNRVKRFWSAPFSVATGCFIGMSAGCGPSATPDTTAGNGGHAGTGGVTGAGGTGGTAAQGGGGTGGGASVAQNQAGTNTITDTPAANPQSVMSMAGIEAAYADIKSLTVPLPSF